MTIHEYAPALIKKTVVGRGAATKEQVQFMVARLLRLKSRRRSPPTRQTVSRARSRA